MEMLALEEGDVLVKTARNAIQSHLSGTKLQPSHIANPGLKEERGVFVSLLDHLNGGWLRGCIGNPFATQPLLEQAAIAAVEAATIDFRFEPVVLCEMTNRIVVEVTVLSPLEAVLVKNPLELRDKVTVGRDGLLVDGMGSRGVLLPQVALAEGFDSEDFLSQCCLKAGLPPDAWLTENVRVSSFQAQVFAEEKPNGRVFERRLKPEDK